MQLRNYQQDAVNGIYDYLRDGIGTSPLVTAPTASGKSVMIAEFCRKTCSEWKGVRIVCVTHSRELISQNEKELRQHYKESNTGIYSAGIGKRNTTAQILFVGIQSIYKKAFQLGKVDILIVDEAHCIPRNAETRYGKFIADLKIANPNLVCVGFTATPYRLDSGTLVEGEDALFDGIAYVCEMKRLISEGWLCPVVSKGGVTKIDLKGVHIRAGDYASNELAHAADDPEIVRLAVAEIVAYGKDRKAWLLFCSGVVHAEHVANEVRKHGIEAEVVTGETPKAERDTTVKKFKDGKLRCLVNVAVFTTGFNAPICDLIALLMATKSTGKYVQIVGRGMRTYPNKENCLLMDYGGNVLEHGMVDDVDPVRTRNIFNVVKNPEPVKECPQCHVILHTRVMQCPACDFIFTATAAHGVEAYAGAVLKDQQETFVVEVKDTWISRHKKSGKPDSVKVAFYDGAEKEYAMWLALDHEGYAREKALSIVKQFGGSATTVEMALKESSTWKPVTHIQVRPDGKFFRIEGMVFGKANPKQSTLLDGEEQFKYY